MTDRTHLPYMRPAATRSGRRRPLSGLLRELVWRDEHHLPADRTPANLAHLDQRMRDAEASHFILLVATVGVVAHAAARGWWGAAGRRCLRGDVLPGASNQSPSSTRLVSSKRQRCDELGGPSSSNMIWSSKHQSHSSPGSNERTRGWPVSWWWTVAC